MIAVPIAPTRTGFHVYPETGGSYKSGGSSIPGNGPHPVPYSREPIFIQYLFSFKVFYLYFLRTETGKTVSGIEEFRVNPVTVISKYRCC